MCIRDSLATAGHRLVIVARDVERLAERRDALLSLGAPEVEVIAADLTDQGQRDVVADRLRDPGRPVDLLINNAGSTLGTEFLQADEADLVRQVNLNAVSVMVLTHAALAGKAAWV